MSEWRSGQWGPTTIRGGYSYENTPCAGDTVYSEADSGEWIVITGLTKANPHKVVVMNPVTNVKFPFGPKWETAVKFKRGQQGHAIDLLREVLGAVEIEDESAKTQANWIIGGRRGGHR